MWVVVFMIPYTNICFDIFLVQDTNFDMDIYYSSRCIHDYIPCVYIRLDIFVVQDTNFDFDVYSCYICIYDTIY